MPTDSQTGMESQNIYKIDRAVAKKIRSACSYVTIAR